MTQSMEALYAARLGRYTTALRNGKPDRVPIRPFVAEFAAKYAGYTCQQVTQDYELAFAAARKCAADFDWDATVGNMVYVWSGLTQAIGLKYYAVPGVELPPDTGFQYVEPPEGRESMQADEYDRLIADPTRFLFEVWLPRVSADARPIGAPVTLRNNLSFLKGGMALMNYFNAFGVQAARLRAECGTPPAIAGILKAPLDILADKLRGYLGLTRDLLEQPDRVLAACEALAPHLQRIALGGADPSGAAPIALWMHRGCIPFISRKHFETIYWATLRPVVEALWAAGYQVLFYAEGKWGPHLPAFAELPDRSIVFHVDRDDIAEAHRILGHKFCLSGGVPNYLLAYGKPADVRDCCRRIIDAVAGDGGYIMDASAIVQNDARIENVRAMTDATREYGVYGSPTPTFVSDSATNNAKNSENPANSSDASRRPERARPGVCVPWEEKLAELPAGFASGPGDAALVRRTWEATDELAHVFIWHCLVSF